MEINKAILLLTLLFFSISAIVGQVVRKPITDCTPQFYVFKENGKYGVKNAESDKVTTAAKYNDISLCLTYNGKFGKAKKNGKWAVIDKTGEPTTRFIFNHIEAVPEDYSESFLMASPAVGQWVLIGSSGKPVSEKTYHEIVGSPLSMFEVRRHKLWGVLDTTGAELIPLNYDDVTFLSSGAYAVQKNDKYGILFTNEGDDIPIVFESVKKVKKGFAAYQNSYYKLFTEKGRELDIEELEQISHYGNIYHDDEILVKKHGKYGLISIDSGWIVPARYDSIQDYLDYHVVMLDSLYGVYSKEGQLIFPAKYDSYRRSNKDFIVEMKGKMGVIGEDGNELIPVKYDQLIRLVNPRPHGLNYTYGVLQDNSWVLALPDGKLVDSLHFSQLKQIDNKLIIATRGEQKYIGEFDGEKFTFYYNFPLDDCGSLYLWTDTYTFRKEGKVGIINFNQPIGNLPGSIVHQAAFDSIYYDENNRHLITVKKDKLGIMNRQGKIILPCEYDEVVAVRRGDVATHHYLIVRNEEEELKIAANGTIERMDKTNK